MSLLLPENSPASTRSDVHHFVRLMTRSDLEVVVAWHRLAFPTGFYSQLGDGFMKKWFTTHMNSKAAVSLVVCDSQGAVVGYLLGTTDDAKYREASRGQGFALFSRGVSALASRPRLWTDFARVRARHYAGRSVRATGRILGTNSTAASNKMRVVEGELVYICVEPEHRRRGAGAVLLEAFTGEAIRSKTNRLHLITESDNRGAQQFYGRHGWQVMDNTARALDGRTLVRIHKYLGLGTPCVG
jgi:ribosomal protein S18 acetylase RimI-like enzyme